MVMIIVASRTRKDLAESICINCEQKKQPMNRTALNKRIIELSLFLLWLCVYQGESITTDRVTRDFLKAANRARSPKTQEYILKRCPESIDFISTSSLAKAEVSPGHWDP